MARISQEEREQIEAELWLFTVGNFDTDGKCYVCEEPITYKDFEAVLIDPNEPFKTSNLKTLCTFCRRNARSEGVSAYEKRFKQSSQLKERMRMRLATEERYRREKERSKILQSIASKNDQIKTLENEIRLLRLTEKVLSDKFCEVMIEKRLCGKNDCEHLKPANGKDLVPESFSYASFQFEQLNTDCQVVTQPFKFSGYVVSINYPHKVYFKLYQMPHFVLYTKVETEIYNINGFVEATQEEIDEIVKRYQLCDSELYKSTAEAYLRAFFRKHRVDTIREVFKSKPLHKAFTATFNEISKRVPNMVAHRKAIFPVDIPEPMLKEMRELRLINR